MREMVTLTFIEPSGQCVRVPAQPSEDALLEVERRLGPGWGLLHDVAREGPEDGLPVMIILHSDTLFRRGPAHTEATLPLRRLTSLSPSEWESLPTIHGTAVVAKVHPGDEE
jgi:hypothetical protein